MLEGLLAQVRGEPGVRVLSVDQQLRAAVAFDHRDAITKFGSTRTFSFGPLDIITLDDSLAIRRRHYGASVQASASLFGQGYDDTRMGRILYRPDVEYGTKRKGDQPVALTRQGEELADWYEAEVIRRAKPS